MTLDEIKSLPERATIDGRSVRLVCQVGRDMMPGVEMDRRLSVVLRLELAEGEGAAPDLEMKRIWVISGDKISTASVERWMWTPDWQFGTREGPDWDDPVVDVAAEVRDSAGGLTRLIAKNLSVGYCW